MVGVASGDQRPLREQPASGPPEERSHHHDGREPAPDQVGFRFACQPGCSACCDREGEVFLSPEDLVRIAAHLGMEAADFEAKYVYRTSRSLRLRKPPDRQCLFHRDNRCSIHVVKPVQCRVFPFWPETIETEAAWAEAAAFCPGMNQGPLVQIEVAREISTEMRRAYPQMYPEVMSPFPPRL